MREKISKAFKALALIVLLGGIGYNLWIVGQFLLEMRISRDPLIHGLILLGILIASLILIPEMRSHSDRVIYLLLFPIFSVFAEVLLIGTLIVALFFLISGPWLAYQTGGPARYYFILGVFWSLPLARLWMNPSPPDARPDYPDSNWGIVIGWTVLSLMTGFFVMVLAKSTMTDEQHDSNDSPKRNPSDAS